MQCVLGWGQDKWKFDNLIKFVMQIINIIKQHHIITFPWELCIGVTVMTGGEALWPDWFELWLLRYIGKGAWCLEWLDCWLDAGDEAGDTGDSSFS